MKTPSPKSTSNKLPRGLAKTTDGDEIMRKQARSHYKMIIENLADIAANGRNEAARVSAMKELLDRGFGKNHLMVQQEAPPGTEIQVIFGDNSPVIEGIVNGGQEPA